MEESFRRFTSELLNEKVVIFVTKHNVTSEAIRDDEFLQIKQNQNWHSEAITYMSQTGSDTITEISY